MTCSHPRFSGPAGQVVLDRGQTAPTVRTVAELLRLLPSDSGDVAGPSLAGEGGERRGNESEGVTEGPDRQIRPKQRKNTARPGRTPVHRCRASVGLRDLGVKSGLPRNKKSPPGGRGWRPGLAGISTAQHGIRTAAVAVGQVQSPPPEEASDHAATSYTTSAIVR
jgi:hypothetical protein